MMMNNRKAWERPVLVVVAIIAVAVMLMAFRFERRMVNQRLMFYQLQAIRKSVDLFKAITRRNPSNLQELTRTEFSFPDERQKRRFFDSPSTDDRGAFLDPFGHPYAYDANTGWVRSQTRGYEYW